MCKSVLYRYIKLPNCFQYRANTCSIQSSNLSLMGKWRRGEQCFFSPIKHCVGKIFLFEKTVWVGFSRDRLVSCPVRHPIMNMLLLSCGRNSYRGNSWDDKIVYICLITNSMYAFQQQLTEWVILRSSWAQWLVWCFYCWSNPPGHHQNLPLWSEGNCLFTLTVCELMKIINVTTLLVRAHATIHRFGD